MNNEDKQDPIKFVDNWLTIRTLKDTIKDYVESKGYDGLDFMSNLISNVHGLTTDIEWDLAWDLAFERPDIVKKELADVLIYAIALANHLELDIATIIALRIQNNQKQKDNNGE